MKSKKVHAVHLHRKNRLRHLQKGGVMKTLTPDLDRRTRAWLAEAFRQTSRWRWDKAVEYPNDPRNGKSAAALSGIVAYVQQKQGGGIYDMTTLVAACEEVDFPVMGEDVYGFPGLESQLLASRYGFDQEPGIPDDVSLRLPAFTSQSRPNSCASHLGAEKSDRFVVVEAQRPAGLVARIVTAILGADEVSCLDDDGQIWSRARFDAPRIRRR
jgi:hypothetical protein